MASVVALTSMRPLAVAVLLASVACASDGPSKPSQPAVAEVAIEPQSPPILLMGDTLRLTALVRDAAGLYLTDRIVGWSSSNVAVATVSTAGTVTAVAPGTTAIAASTAGVTGTATITVAAPRIVTLYGPAPIPTGASVKIPTSYTAEATWAVNGVIGGDATFGTVDKFGLYTAPTRVPDRPNVEVSLTVAGSHFVNGIAFLTIVSASP